MSSSSLSGMAADDTRSEFLALQFSGDMCVAMYTATANAGHFYFVAHS